MNPMYCTVCSDKKRFENAVYTSERINNSLSVILRKYDVKSLPHSRNHIRKYGQNVHFMCGTCVNVNKNRLSNSDMNIYNCIVKIEQLIENETLTSNDYYSILRLLAGDYSYYYHQIELIWKNKNKTAGR